MDTSYNKYPRIFLFLPTLFVGGTERQVFYLAKALNKRKFHVVVGTFYRGGIFWNRLEKEGVELVSFDRKSKFDFIHFFKKITSFLRKEKFDIVQTFLPVANFYGVKAAKKAGIENIFASIRSSYMDFSKYSLGSRIYFYLSRKIINKYASKVIYNSFAGKSYHQKIGFKKEAVVIWNGVDFKKLYKIKNTVNKEKKKRELNLSDNAKIICNISRLDPKKGHSILLDSFYLLSRNFKDIYLLIVGDGKNEIKKEIIKTAKKYNLQERVRFLGMREDVYEIISISNALVSSSIFGEGISNSIIEAMSLGVPVIATDVGDHSLMLNQVRGLIVPSRNSYALKEAFEKILFDENLKSTLVRNAHDFVEKNFMIDKMVDNYLKIWNGKLTAQEHS